MYKIVVWHNPKKDSYYYKLIKGNYVNYKVGYKNQYGHEVIVVVEDVSFLGRKTSLKTKLINKLICLLNKLK